MGATAWQGLIKWKESLVENVTWKNDIFIQSQFPNFNLEDKVVVIWVVLIEIEQKTWSSRYKIWKIVPRFGKYTIGNISNKIRQRMT